MVLVKLLDKSGVSGPPLTPTPPQSVMAAVPISDPPHLRMRRAQETESHVERTKLRPRGYFSLFRFGHDVQHFFQIPPSHPHVD